MILKIFTQPHCTKSLLAKAIVAKIEHKVKVEEYDITTEDGLSEALYYKTASTPTIIILNQNKEILAKFLGVVPQIEEIEKIIN